MSSPELVYRTANTTITCDYPDVYEPHIKFFCKKNHFHCDDILSTKSSPKSKGTFTLTGSSRAFNISISHVTSQDAGDYWCGVESNDGRSLTPISYNNECCTVTAKTTIRCDYPEDKYKSWIKFFCKGKSFTCEDNLSTKSYPKSNRTFALSNISHSFNMSISNVSSQDDGNYWCGVRSPVGIHRAALTKIKLSIKSISDIGIVVIIITGLVFLVLKDCTYEEIQERPQQPDQPENALTSIYVTASIPTDVAASPHYNSINFQSCSDKAGGEAMKRISSACEYSTLTLSKCPTNPTITIPSRPAEENLYSVINEPEPK
uniref:Ig-like domain-containing protein n=1 Tax=Oreochromis aureus TaxID=47969 RepID=A0AAZ1XJ38_OREAU